MSNSLITRMAQDPQIVLFSATFAEVVRTFAVRFAPGANEIRLKQEELSLDAIKQFFMGESSLLSSLFVRQSLTREMLLRHRLRG